MDPFTLFQIGLTLYSGFQQGEAQKKSSEADASYYNALAEEAEKEIKFYGKSAGQKQSQLRKQSTSLYETQKAAIVGLGASLSSVTAEDIATTSLESQMTDEMLLRYDADMQRYNQLKKAEQYRKAAQTGLEAGKIQQFNTLLGTATQVAPQISNLITKGSIPKYA